MLIFLHHSYFASHRHGEQMFILPIWYTFSLLSFIKERKNIIRCMQLSFSWLVTAGIWQNHQNKMQMTIRNAFTHPSIIIHFYPIFNYIWNFKANRQSEWFTFSYNSSILVILDLFFFCFSNCLSKKKVMWKRDTFECVSDTSLTQKEVHFVIEQLNRLFYELFIAILFDAVCSYFFSLSYFINETISCTNQEPSAHSTTSCH